MSISWLITQLAAALLLPPLNGLLLVLVGAMAWGRYPRLGRACVLAGFVLLTALSLGVVARALQVPLEARYPALPVDTGPRLAADAIVVLGAGRYRGAPEFGGDDVHGATLDRLRYGALLARRSGKPLLVSGGAPDGGSRPEAEVMRQSLERDFGVTVRWIESSSDNTYENARRSAEMLLPLGIRKVALVTHAWHMPRAVGAFTSAGFGVLPAPTAYASTRPLNAMDFVPRAGAMMASSRALHEWIGLLWYRLRS
ncbi:MAG: YdcF family protein [Rhodocyclaceae bacterium]|nr:YdcF family protein [Rhodocyclaceae bacterium]